LKEFFSNMLATPEQPTGVHVEQAQLELQLKVWKELAISKQVLMRTATDALKLDPNCSQDELKVALEAFIKKISKADAEVVQAREQAKHAITELEKKLAITERAQSVAESSAAELRAKLENTTQEIAIERAAAAKEQQRLKTLLAEREKALKGINTALADTPENVLKKMNAFKKQKQEEADARREVEASFQTLRREKQEQDQKMTSVQENSAKLVTQHRDVHALSVKLQEQLKALEAKDVPAVPELDDELIKSIENPDAKPDPKAKDGKSGKSKK
jgi:colicin import membrane protein